MQPRQSNKGFPDAAAARAEVSALHNKGNISWFVREASGWGVYYFTLGQLERLVKVQHASTTKTGSARRTKRHCGTEAEARKELAAIKKRGGIGYIHPVGWRKYEQAAAQPDGGFNVFSYTIGEIAKHVNTKSALS